MPQTKQKEEWVRHYKEQLNEFFGKGSGWYVFQSAGKIKLEVISNGKKENELAAWIPEYLQKNRIFSQLLPKRKCGGDCLGSYE